MTGIKMSDQYPSDFTIEIDRPQLRKYLCAKALLSWLAWFIFLGGFFGFGSIADTLDRRELSHAQAWKLAVSHIGVGVTAGSLLATLLYLAISHRTAVRKAAALEVSVEDAFLRIRQHELVNDRKLHFRAIVDYATTQDALMSWFGIQALRMNTMAGPISLPGIKDCLKARDVLSEIDRQRENQ